MGFTKENENEWDNIETSDDTNNENEDFILDNTFRKCQRYSKVYTIRKYIVLILHLIIRKKVVLLYIYFFRCSYIIMFIKFTFYTFTKFVIRNFSNIVACLFAPLSILSL